MASLSALEEMSGVLPVFRAWPGLPWLPAADDPASVPVSPGEAFAPADFPDGGEGSAALPAVGGFEA